MCGLPELSAKNEFLATFCFGVRGLSEFWRRFPAKMKTKGLFPGFRGRARGNNPQNTKEHPKADFLAAFSCFWMLSVWRNSGVFVRFWRSAPAPLGAAYQPTTNKRVPRKTESTHGKSGSANR